MHRSYCHKGHQLLLAPTSASRHLVHRNVNLVSSRRRRPASTFIAAASEEPTQVTGSQGQGLHKRGPVVVIDNYDSFTYNLCQVSWV